jgi:hypothetical protein
VPISAISLLGEVEAQDAHVNKISDATSRRDVVNDLWLETAYNLFRSFKDKGLFKEVRVHQLITSSFCTFAGDSNVLNFFNKEVLSKEHSSLSYHTLACSRCDYPGVFAFA